MLKDLIGVFKKWLKIYAEEVLLASLRREAPRRSTDRRSLEGRANIGEVKNACLVLNTAEYCLTTAGQVRPQAGRPFETKRLTRVCVSYAARGHVQGAHRRPPGGRDHLPRGARSVHCVRPSLNDVVERRIYLTDSPFAFPSVISSSLLSLLKELENSIEPHTTSITRTSWDTIENVSGPSTYVPALVDSIDAMGDLVREGVEGKRWLRSWCDKAVGCVVHPLTSSCSGRNFDSDESQTSSVTCRVVMVKMNQALVRSRPLKKVGAEQVRQHPPPRPPPSPPLKLRA